MKKIFIFLTITLCQIGAEVHAITQQELYCYIKKVGIKHPQIVLKQALLESGHFKSNIFKKKNNLFGFRYKAYIRFKSWKACVDFYKRWQDRNYKSDNLDYYKFLQHLNYSGHKEVKYDAYLRRVPIDKNLDKHCSD